MGVLPELCVGEGGSLIKKKRSLGYKWVKMVRMRGLRHNDASEQDKNK